MSRSDAVNLIFDEVKDKLISQINSIDDLNTKSGVIIGFVGLVITFAFGLNVSSKYTSFFELGITFLFFAIISAFLAYFSKTYRRDPDPRSLAKKYLRKDSKSVKETLISNFVVSYEENIDKIEYKKDFTNFSLVFVFIALILISISRFGA